MAGFIYIMSNPAFPNLLKIGKSKKDPTTDRVNELNQTGVPEPFKVEYYAFVEDEDYLERVVHQKFASQRPNKNREFFSVDCVEAIDVIRQLSKPKSKIKYEEVLYVTPEEIERFRAEQEREAKQRAVEEDRRFKAEAEAARQAAKAKAEYEEAERLRAAEEKRRFDEEQNLRNEAKRKAEAEEEQQIRTAVAKILMRRKLANLVFWLTAIVLFPAVLFETEKGGMSAIFTAMAGTLLVSGLIWLAITPQQSLYDVDPNWHNNRPKRWFEKYLNNPIGRFLFTNKLGNFVLACLPFGLLFGLIFLGAEQKPSDPNRFWLWLWCTVFWPAIGVIFSALNKDR